MSKLLDDPYSVPRDIETGATLDSIKYKKDCSDFIKMPDGTITGEAKYCKWSTVCRQVDYDPISKKLVPMESHYQPFIDEDGELQWEMLCTGMHDYRPLRERVEDDKAS